jgi:glycosyltransferase A (GT-A) superfamily protein (DUF2064 family)
VDKANAVIVLARAPVAARMDVRLAERVAEAHARDPESESLIAALSKSERSYEVTIAYSPPHEGATVRLWLRGADRYEPQPSGDRGIAIATTMERAFKRGAERVVVVGSHDEQHLVTRDRLEDAFQWLEQVDCVLGPLDGGREATGEVSGFWVIGGRRALPGLRELPWGEPGLLAAMRERLVESELSWCELERSAVRVGELRSRPAARA